MTRPLSFNRLSDNLLNHGDFRTMVTTSIATTEPTPGEELPLPELPTFASVEEERRHRKQRLAGALRLFAHHGLDEGVAGHISVRDPQAPDHFWVNPFGVHFSRVSAKDLVLVDNDGHVVEGTRSVNRAAFAIHSEIHNARPDVTAAAHAHSLYGRALAAMGQRLAPLVQEACAFYEDHAIYQEYDGLIVSQDQGRRIAERLGQLKAVILQHHGLITVGGSVDEAAFWFISLERCARIQLVAQAAGTPIEMPHEEALIARKQFGSRKIAWHSFQPIWDFIVGNEPELLIDTADESA